MMNNVFSFKRFAMLFGKHTIEHYKIYLLATGVMTGILAMFMGFATYMQSGRLDPDGQFGFFLGFFLLGGTIFTSIIFSDLGDRKKSIAQLILPVSHFERYLVAWVYTFVIFQVVFPLCFYAVVLLVLNFIPLANGEKNDLLNVFTNANEKGYNIIFLVFMVLHSVSFLGAIFFEKYHFIKTAFILFVFILFVSVANSLMVKFLIGSTFRNTGPFSTLDVSYIENGNQFFRKITASDVVLNMSAYGMVVVVLLMWAGAYFKLKEKEI